MKIYTYTWRDEAGHHRGWDRLKSRALRDNIYAIRAPGADPGQEPNVEEVKFTPSMRDVLRLMNEYATNADVL